ncbi:MAG: hypothetical protein QOE54_6604, partial [Streptosporangiaceae bacterium]|nr:hypothetical protein [Streptosporangiaceae bacterium]
RAKQIQELELSKVRRLPLLNQTGVS